MLNKVHMWNISYAIIIATHECHYNIYVNISFVFIVK